MADQKLTKSTDELRAAQLFIGQNILEIPFFQRPYKWDKNRIAQFKTDLLAIVDGQVDVHFVGAIITNPRDKSNSALPDVIEVIDGQQRLTTVYIYLCAVTRALLDADEIAEAKNLFLQFLIHNLHEGPGSNIRLQSSQDDRKAVNDMIEDLLAFKKFRDHLGDFKLKKLHELTSTQHRSRVTVNFKDAVRFLGDQFDEAGVERIRAIREALLQSLTFVQIAVKDPTVGPKVFDSLNSRQQPMTTGDLVRNDIFSRLAHESLDKLAQLNAQHWRPFYERFQVADKNFFDEYFFPYGLIQDPRLTKSSVYKSLLASWQGKDPEDVIAQLGRYQAIFLALVSGSHVPDVDPEVDRAVRKLFESRVPASTFPFIMQLVDAAAPDGELDPAVAVELLEAVEAFLVRRQLSGIEPTGLHAVFKGLWQELDGDYSVQAMVSGIQAHQTVPWSTDDDVRSGIATRNAYRAKITPFVLREFDLSIHGDDSGLPAEIEHVLPQTAGSDWSSFTQAERKTYVDTLANLLPLTKAMNIGVSNGPYAAKRVEYAKSAFKSTRSFAETHSEWNPLLLSERSATLQDWAIERWPDPAKG